jgi:uncharacterized OB-fold protein
MTLKDYKIPESPCPNCGKVCDAATGDRDPNPGDASLCLYCGHLTVYDDALKMREPTDAETKWLAGNPKLVLYSKAIAEYREKKNRSAP